MAIGELELAGILDAEGEGYAVRAACGEEFRKLIDPDGGRFVIYIAAFCLSLLVYEPVDSCNIQRQGRAIYPGTLGIAGETEYFGRPGIIDLQREVVAGHNIIQCRRTETGESDLQGGDLVVEGFPYVVEVSREEGAEMTGYIRLGAEDRKEVGVRSLHEFDDVRQGTVFAASPFLQIPDEGCQK